MKLIPRIFVAIAVLAFAVACNTSPTLTPTPLPKPVFFQGQSVNLSPASESKIALGGQKRFVRDVGEFSFVVNNSKDITTQVGDDFVPGFEVISNFNSKSEDRRLLSARKFCVKAKPCKYLEAFFLDTFSIFNDEDSQLWIQVPFGWHKEKSK